MSVFTNPAGGAAEHAAAYVTAILDPSEALALFEVLRRANLRLLARASAADLRRTGVHAERGEESLEHLRRLYAGHDLLHLRQIERVRRTL